MRGNSRVCRVHSLRVANAPSHRPSGVRGRRLVDRLRVVRAVRRIHTNTVHRTPPSSNRRTEVRLVRSHYGTTEAHPWRSRTRPWFRSVQASTSRSVVSGPYVVHSTPSMRSIGCEPFVRLRSKGGRGDVAVCTCNNPTWKGSVHRPFHRTCPRTVVLCGQRRATKQPKLGWVSGETGYPGLSSHSGTTGSRASGPIVSR